MTETDFNGTLATKGGIKYASGYKYQMLENAVADSGVRPCALIDHEYFSISVDGVILVKKGYAWDGASSVAIDTPGTIYASVFHDAGYQAIRLGLLDPVWREDLDRMYERLCREGGVPWFRAKYHYLGLRLGGDVYNHLPDSAYPEKIAP